MIDLSFWGKAQPADVTHAGASYHPLAYHLLDVAACAREILTRRPLASATAARLFDVREEDVVPPLVALIALHDLGKCAPKFQAKSPEHWPPALGAYTPGHAQRGHHTKDGFTLWDWELESVARARLWPSGENALRALAPAIFGHHGRPVGAAAYGDTSSQVFGRVGLVEALRHADAVLALLQPRPIDAIDLTVERAALASWWVAGLTTLADWVGSNQEWFPYSAPLDDDPDLSNYWCEASARATQAVKAAGLVAPRVAPLRTLAAITRQNAPTPTQQWVESVTLPDGPVLAIIEDVTGAGKTEAAHMLVHRLMASGRATGAYWAMPTQATANAMYGRQTALFDALYEDSAGEKPSLVLAHGQQRLHRGFRATVLGSTNPNGVGAPAAVSDQDPTSAASCAAFLADDRRRALLADIGAGTVDQALLAVLPSRFNALRLFALSDKVLIIDEAHAFDAYMGVEVQELLRFHAALGGSAIVLSATLPARQRERLAACWVEGVGGGRRRGSVMTLTNSSEYPLATLVSGGDSPVRENALRAAVWSRRTVRVRLVHDIDAALEHVIEAHGRGCTVAWVRNTVDDCLAAATRLRERGVVPLIFHARFAQGDRQQREQEVTALFGRQASAADRRSRVLVATQVVEQSLDLDFDAMVSDLAPVDLLVQRAGRLWRHPERDSVRPIGEDDRELVVLAPAFLADPPKEWLGGSFAGTSYVYGDAGVLWRTVKALDEAGMIDTPDGLRALIGAVYDDDEVPDSLLAAAQRAEGKKSAFAATANYATLKVTDGYESSSHGWVSDVRAPTRLGDQQSILRLARVAGDGRLTPWVEDETDPWRAWALSEVRLSRWKVPPGATAEAKYDVAVAAVRAEWGAWEQDRPVLPLSESLIEPGLYNGVLLSADGSALRSLTYHPAYGLMYASIESMSTHATGAG